MNRIITIILIFIALTTSLWSPWSTPYLPTFHDQYQAERIYEMSRAIAFGQFPVRYVQNLGYSYGYPLFNFYAPLPYYLGAFFFLLGFNLIIATKLMISIGFCLAFITMYYLASRVWSRGIGILAATLYTFAPYHAVQLYVRGAIGELFAYAFLPLVALGLYEIFHHKPNSKNLTLSILGTTLLYLSHTISLYMTLLILFPIFVLFLFKYFKNYKLLKFNDVRALQGIGFRISLFILPLLLTASFWIPAFFELSSTQLNSQSGNNVDFTKHFVTLSQLWSSPWGYGGSDLLSDGMSFMIGKISILLAITSICFYIFQNLKFKKPIPKSILILTIISILLVYITTDYSLWLWQIIPMMQLIQFPWRFLTFINLTICLLAVSSVSALKITKFKYIIPFTLAALIFQLLFSTNFSIKFFRAQSFYQKNSQEITETAHLAGEVSAISDEYLFKNIPKPQSGNTPNITCTMPCRITSDQYTPHRYEIDISAQSAGYLHIAKANFPGFKAFISNIPVPISEFQGQLGVAIPKAGAYQISFQLFDTLPRALGNIISITTILLVIIYKLLKKV